MADEWGTIRAAIAAKANNVDELRRAAASRRRPGPRPELRVLSPTYTLLDQPMAAIEIYALAFPLELLISNAAGMDRVDEQASRISRAIQVEWQSGVKLGMASAGPGQTMVRHSRITPFTPSLEEFSDTGMAGYTATCEVECIDYLATARTA